MKAVEEILRQHIAETMLFSSKGYPYPDDASFLENSIIDSMNVMELVVFLEEQWAIQIDDHEIVPENFDSIARLAEFVRRRQAVVA